MTLDWIALHRTALHYTAPHRTALHCTALQALRCVNSVWLLPALFFAVPAPFAAFCAARRCFEAWQFLILVLPKADVVVLHKPLLCVRNVHQRPRCAALVGHAAMLCPVVEQQRLPSLHARRGVRGNNVVLYVRPGDELGWT